MLAAGLEHTLVATGQEDNVVVIRRGAQSEVQSGVDRVQAGVVESLPDIAIGADGRKLISKEPVVLINLPKRGSNKASNVVIRGVTPNGLLLRPQVRLVEGRMFQPGTSEIIAGRSIAQGFQGAGVGETLRFASRDWTVVGVFDAGRTGFDSEIWGDAEQMLQAFRRLGFSVLVFRLGDSERFDAVKKEIESDPRLTLEAKRETRFYADQSESLSKFISYLGTTISVIFSIGAIIGAMITMYASVASRTAEIGTLRALGFPAHVDPRRVSRRGADAWTSWRGHRARRRVVHAGAFHLDDELPDLRGDRFLVPDDAGDRCRRPSPSRWRWASSEDSFRQLAPRA
jgi:hypothetical protein